MVVATLSGARRVQIDHVHPLGSLGGEPSRELDRIAAELRDPVVSALVQSHHRSAEQVDGRYRRATTF